MSQQTPLPATDPPHPPSASCTAPTSQPTRATKAVRTDRSLTPSNSTFRRPSTAPAPLRAAPPRVSASQTRATSRSPHTPHGSPSSTNQPAPHRHAPAVHPSPTHSPGWPSRAPHSTATALPTTTNPAAHPPAHPDRTATATPLLSPSSLVPHPSPRSTDVLARSDAAKARATTETRRLPTARLPPPRETPLAPIEVAQTRPAHSTAKSSPPPTAPAPQSLRAQSRPSLDPIEALGDPPAKQHRETTVSRHPSLRSRPLGNSSFRAPLHSRGTFPREWRGARMKTRTDSTETAIIATIERPTSHPPQPPTARQKTDTPPPTMPPTGRSA